MRATLDVLQTWDAPGIGAATVATGAISPAAWQWFKDDRLLIVSDSLPVPEVYAALGRFVALFEGAA